MSADLSQIMERASQALCRMDYLECEALCLEALAAARRGEDWANYGRILMPLQECRRQRRMIAADGHVRLGTSQLEGEPQQWLTGYEPACIAMTSPHTRDAAQQLSRAVHDGRRFVEILWVDNESFADMWTVRSLADPPPELAPPEPAPPDGVSITVDAPPKAWREKWMTNDPLVSARHGEHGQTAQMSTQTAPSAQTAISSEIHTTPADWFLNIGEHLGDAALEQVRAPLGSVERVAELERCLAVVTDHEILHQRLGDAARAMLQR